MMAFGKKSPDPVVAAIEELTEQVKLMREDVQRAGVMSGLLSRPGGLAFHDVVRAAKTFAEQTKD